MTGGQDVRAGLVDRFDDEVADRLVAVGRRVHAQRARVLGAKAFRGDRQAGAIAGDQLHMDDAGRLLAAHPEPVSWSAERDGGTCRIAGDRPAQIRGLRALTDPGVDCLLDAAANPVHVLPHFEEGNRQAAALADGQPLGSGDLVVVYDLLERAVPQR
jgi:hypothetical protein